MLVMVRTSCCESFKAFGTFCSVCPHRLENQQALADTQQLLENPSSLRHCSRAERRRALLEQSPSLSRAMADGC